METNAYVEHGYENRADYLNTVAEGYGVSRGTVYALADLLGPDEDFDGLISALDDLDTAF